MGAARVVGLVALAFVVGADALVAQGRPQRPAAADTAAEPMRDVELRFDREVFQYAAQGRRDPFAPLSADDGLGVRFEQLALTGIMFSPAAGQSIAILNDARTKKTFRVRRGDLVGNARVLNISPTQVLFAVDVFGVVRQERLELKKDPRGDTR